MIVLKSRQTHSCSSADNQNRCCISPPNCWCLNMFSLTSVTLSLKDTVSPRSHLSRSQRQPSVGCCVRSMYWSTPFSSRAKPPRGPGTRVGPPTTVKLNVRVCSKVPTSFTNVSLWITMSVPGSDQNVCVHLLPVHMKEKQKEQLPTDNWHSTAKLFWGVISLDKQQSHKADCVWSFQHV